MDAMTYTVKLVNPIPKPIPRPTPNKIPKGNSSSFFLVISICCDHWFVKKKSVNTAHAPI